MQFIDTHTHIYLEEFDVDRNEMIGRAIQAGVGTFLLPNIDRASLPALLSLCDAWPGHCLPMIGLHPTSVKDDYEEELAMVDQQLNERKFFAIGEIGIDLYWDKTYLHQQQIAFRHQLKLAKALHLPVAVHMRNSFEQVYSILREEADSSLRGVFHCFSGNIQQARKVIELGFLLGIGGVVTFRNSGLQEVIKETGLGHMVLETDAPFLAPEPFRGKRNECSYIPLIAEKIASLQNIALATVAEITTANARKLFNINNKF